jgi:membrane protein YqaA with SNARE-associated domain
MSAMIFMAIGKFVRYWIVATAANAVAATIG